MYNSLIKVICLHNIGLNYSLNSVMSPICSTKWVSWRHSPLHQHPVACATTSQNFPESLSKVGITEGVTYRVDCAIYVTEPVSWNKKNKKPLKKKIKSILFRYTFWFLPLILDVIMHAIFYKRIACKATVF